MANNRVDETMAAKSLEAWVILNKKGQYVAKVQVYRSKAGRCLVNVWQQEEATRRSVLTWRGLPLTDKAPQAEMVLSKFRFQTKSAGGYGYDKLAAALKGMIVDGVILYNHCDVDPATARLLKAYNRAAGKGPVTVTAWDRKAKKIGAFFTNWSSGKQRFTSLYTEAGLNRLKTLGYQVIQAI